jgi:hypothetical protein
VSLAGARMARDSAKRLLIDGVDPNEPAPWQFGGSNKPFATPAEWPAAGKNAEPVKAELTGFAKVTGEAKIMIDIPGLPSRTVNVPLNGTVNANGPGSLGTSSPDAATPGH